MTKRDRANLVVSLDVDQHEYEAVLASGYRDLPLLVTTVRIERDFVAGQVDMRCFSQREPVLA